MPFNQLYLDLDKRIRNFYTDNPNDKQLKQLQKNLKKIRGMLPLHDSQFNEASQYHQSAFKALQDCEFILDMIDSCKKAMKYQDNIELRLVPELFKGAHVLIDDSGELVNQLDKSRLFRRYSSHYQEQKMIELKATGLTHEQAIKRVQSSKSDLSIRAEGIFNELLIGKVKINGKDYTWLQFEGHSHQSRTVYKNPINRLVNAILQKFNYSLEKLLHHVDYVRYRFYKKERNIGQYGTSLYTESNPIRLSPIS